MNPSVDHAPICEGVLLVEDDPDIRESITDILVEEGYSVSAAPHGRAALEQLASRAAAPPCLILLDLMMPVMSGPELLATLRKDPRLSTIPVVILSAWPRDAAQEAGTRGWVKKPVDLGKLLDMVRSFCPGTRC